MSLTRSKWYTTLAKNYIYSLIYGQRTHLTFFDFIKYQDLKTLKDFLNKKVCSAQGADYW